VVINDQYINHRVESLRTWTAQLYPSEGG
jgi:hypothetical protein